MASPSRVSDFSIGDGTGCRKSNFQPESGGVDKNDVNNNVNPFSSFSSQQMAVHEGCGTRSPQHGMREKDRRRGFQQQLLATEDYDTLVPLPANTLGETGVDAGFESAKLDKTEGYGNGVAEQGREKDDGKRSSISLCQQMANLEVCDAHICQSTRVEIDEDRVSRCQVDQKMAKTVEHVTKSCQSGMGKTNEKSGFGGQRIEPEDCGINLPQQNGDGYDGKKELKREKYFYYDPPLVEETGVWIPVSVPPMSGSEHEEWTKGFGSNGGTFPEADMGWGQYAGEDQELTMWDVVVEMLLAARGKVSGFASGDVRQVSWISSHLIEQAWKEMAQTLTEANFGTTQEILQVEPPKWLPDSAASACMLCSVRFHPIMCTRHHCRFCGGVFCSGCTKGRSLLPEKFRVGDPQRVCDVCCVRLESVQSYLMDQVSRAAQLPTQDLTDLSTLRSWLNFPWGQSMEYEIYKATNTLRGYNKVGFLRPEKSIPEAILRQAKGLAILTIIKVGMMVTYNIGTGLVVARREDGSWSPPSAISSFGVGWGAQVTRIVHQVGKASNRLELLPKSKIHPVFHVSSLRPHNAGVEDHDRGKSHRTPTAKGKSYAKAVEYMPSGETRVKARSGTNNEISSRFCAETTTPQKSVIYLQAGGEFTDLIIVLRSADAVKTFSSDVHLSVGAGLSAAIGIVGRTAEADVRAGTGGYAACYTYSCSKGAFVGCALEGSMVTTRTQENSRFYGSQSLNAADILLGSLPRPPAAAILYHALADLYQKLGA
ncbi:hypothetical protein RJ640_017399 [Escallonia rubra]|uniref:FYVE-type domain-containing protein n=1 Tax=Escallonia rubra TaxID=112253 RepID=A0AA88UH07_9ASTE|nr:hypothetical protein RJ640_017399 [Escallonia rubra]